MLAGLGAALCWADIPPAAVSDRLAVPAPARLGPVCGGDVQSGGGRLPPGPAAHHAGRNAPETHRGELPNLSLRRLYSMKMGHTGKGWVLLPSY